MMRKPFRIFSFLLALASIPLNSQSPAFTAATEPVIFQRFLENLTDVESLKSHRDSIMGSALPSSLKIRYLDRLTAALEMQGRFSEALDLVLLRRTLESSPELILRMGHLYLETGNLEEAQAVAQELSGDELPDLRIQGAVLQSRIWRIQGHDQAAFQSLREASSDVTGLPGLLYLWESALTSDPGRKKSIATLVSRLYPQSPEALILQNTESERVKIWGSVIPVLPSAAPAAVELSEYFQLGAYGIRENAEAFQGKLPGGLGSRIVEFEGLYRVVVPKNGENESLLTRLKLPFIQKKM